MIKVIASDMDGTLLNEEHQVSKRTAEVIKKACEKGIRFMVVTGRTFQGAVQGLGESNLVCDYIVSSGAQVRNSKKEVVFNGLLKMEGCKKIQAVLDKYPVYSIFCTDHLEYCLGDEKEFEQNILSHIKAFDETIPVNELKSHPMYDLLKEKTIRVEDFEQLERMQLPISKIFLFVDHGSMPDGLERELKEIPNMAISSSGDNNLEITDVTAQKGPVVKNYIESLGYTMEEVMLFGDSMNDYSMLSMNFGATIAMENAEPEIKKICKYVTKSNKEDGVAYAVEELLKKYGFEIE